MLQVGAEDGVLQGVVEGLRRMGESVLGGAAVFGHCRRATRPLRGRVDRAGRASHRPAVPGLERRAVTRPATLPAILRTFRQ